VLTSLSSLQNIFVTGGNSLLPGFDDRLISSLTPNLPVGHPLRVIRSPHADPSFDAWRGLAKWSSSNEARRAFVTRAEYDENGAEYFKDHPFGNRSNF
jgi:actin-related protein 5